MVLQMIIDLEKPLAHTNPMTDDNWLRKAFSPYQPNGENNTTAITEKSMLAVKSWMDAVHLKLNEIKNGMHLLWKSTTTTKVQHRKH